MDLKTYIDAKRGKCPKIARIIGVSPTSVWEWANGKKRLPPERVLKVCNATKWQITPHEIDPGVYPNPWDALPLHVFPKHIVDSLTAQISELKERGYEDD